MTEAKLAVLKEHTPEDDDAHGAGLPHVHPVPIWLLAGVFAMLLVLTWVTFAATYVDLGGFNLWIAMAIATVKGTLVALYFMHLRWDKLFNGFIFLAALVFVFLFVGLSLVDTKEYLPDMAPVKPVVQAVE